MQYFSPLASFGTVMNEKAIKWNIAGRLSTLLVSFFSRPRGSAQGAPRCKLLNTNSIKAQKGCTAAAAAAAAQARARVVFHRESFSIWENTTCAFGASLPRTLLPVGSVEKREKEATMWRPERNYCDHIQSSKRNIHSPRRVFTFSLELEL